MNHLRFAVAALVLAVPAVAGAAVGPQVVRAPLPNGATLLVSEQRNLPIVLVRVLIDAGARRDPAGLGGLANLTAELLTEGTTTRSATEISEAIEFVGGSLGASAGRDFAEVTLSVLAKDLDVGLNLMADVLLRPTFASVELERRREAVLASIRAAKDNPTIVAMNAFVEAFFGAEPYGHPTQGVEATVAEITREDVRAFYMRHYRPAGAVVVVVGDIGPSAARTRIGGALSEWAGEAADAFEYPFAEDGGARSVRIDQALTQASIVMGHRGVARDNPDYEALSVMNYVLGGGGFSSRLMESIRTRAGLAYSVSSFFTVNKAPGSFQVVLQTKNASVADAVARVRAEVERIRAEPIGDRELEDAKRYLTGSFPLRLTSNRKIAGFIGHVWFYGLGLDYADTYLQRINAVTKEDVLRMARHYLHPDRFVEVVVADLARATLPESDPTAAGGGSVPTTPAAER